MTEYWSIYNTSAGDVRATGNGPAGSGALQPLGAGEAMILQTALPGQQLVMKVAGKLSVVANPNYTAPTLALPSNAVRSADGTAWQLGASNGGAPTATKV